MKQWLKFELENPILLLDEDEDEDEREDERLGQTPKAPIIIEDDDDDEPSRHSSRWKAHRNRTKRSAPGMVPWGESSFEKETVADLNSGWELTRSRWANVRSLLRLEIDPITGFRLLWFGKKMEAAFLEGSKELHPDAGTGLKLCAAWKKVEGKVLDRLASERQKKTVQSFGRTLKLFAEQQGLYECVQDYNCERDVGRTISRRRPERHADGQED